MSECKITLIDRVWSDVKYRHLRNHIVWNWKLEFDGRVFDDGGAVAMSAEQAARSAIEKYRDLQENQSRPINRKAS